jgi:nucleotide-binding universal stress UspA family protein
MGWKEILVRVSEEPDWRPVADAAATLAECHGANLVGLAVVHMPDPGDTAYRRGLGGDYLEQRRRDLEEGARRLGEEFRRRCARPGLAVEWRVGDGDLVKVLAAHARYADVLVLGPSDPVEQVAIEEPNLAAPVVLTSGRPVLLVPGTGAAGGVGRRVALAWNGSREAARAASDALPLLAGADRVWVVTVGARGKVGAPPGADVAHYLTRHGATVELVAVDEAGDAGSVLLRRAAALGADLLVMGAYGHSRLRELVLGGATRTVLTHATLPVLMSH